MKISGRVCKKKIERDYWNEMVQSCKEIVKIKDSEHPNIFEKMGLKRKAKQ